jgi:hypothetical protein
MPLQAHCRAAQVGTFPIFYLNYPYSVGNYRQVLGEMLTRAGCTAWPQESLSGGAEDAVLEWLASWFGAGNPGEGPVDLDKITLSEPSPMSHAVTQTLAHSQLLGAAVKLATMGIRTVSGFSHHFGRKACMGPGSAAWPAGTAQHAQHGLHGAPAKG